MANPFETFRKHQAVMLAVFGVLIILVFTVGDSLTQMLGGGGGAIKNPVLVTWTGGEVRRSELASEISRRSLVAQVLADLQNSAFRQANVPDFIAENLAQLRIVVPQRDLNEKATFRYMTLLRKAEQLGIDVSDDAIFDYLDTLIQSPYDRKLQFGREEMNQIIERPQGRRRTSSKVFIELLRNEMKAKEVGDNLFLRGYQLIPPGELLTYYTQVEKQIAAELIAIPVDAFVDQANAPGSDAELEGYFQQYKGDLPGHDRVGGTPLRSPKPGFKQPYKAEVEFIRFSHEEFVERAREQIEKDEEQIKEFYERHKDTDLQLQVSQVSDETTVKPDGEAKQDAADAEASVPEDESAPEDEAAQGDGDATDDAAADADADADAPTATDEAAAAEETSESDAGDKLEAAADPAESDGTTTPDQDSAESEAATDADAPKTAAEIVAETAGDAATKAESDESAGDEDAAEKDAIKYRPLDEVRDYIVRRLSRQRAATLIDETLDPLKEKMTEYSQYAKQGSERSLEQIVAGKGLTVHRIGPYSELEFRDNTEIGNVNGFLRRVITNKGQASFRNPGKIADYDNNNFLFWKIGEVPEAELELKDVRDNEELREAVVRSWKMGVGRGDATGTAQSLAVAAANKMAEQLRGGASPADVAKEVAGGQVIPTGFFSWYSPPVAPDPQGRSAVTLSTIEGVDSPGPEFMRAAFGLGVGEVAVALNHPRTMVYVIRVTDVQPSDETLRADFLDAFKSGPLPNGVGQIARYEIQETVFAWHQELDDEFNVEWQAE